LTRSVAACALALSLAAPAEATAPAGGIAAAAAALRVVTYNVHSGLGSGLAFRATRAAAESNLAAVAQAIAEAAPPGDPVDVIGLNEVDFASRRTGWLDQAAFLAVELRRRTGHPFGVVRGETWTRTIPGFEVRFGNAALVRHPVVRADSCLFDRIDGCRMARPARALPPLLDAGWPARWLREPRGVVGLTIEVGARPIDVLVTHLDAFAVREREAQAAHLLRRLVDSGRTTILLGDMNAVPAPLTRWRRWFGNDATHDILVAGDLHDARLVHAAARRLDASAAWPTFPAGQPRWPLDCVLASSDLVPHAIRTIGGAASDHLGLFVEYTVAPAGIQTTAAAGPPHG
jgi:endonuclease/exonuclease/phosphatase family metal-dependent hydrolase